MNKILGIGILTCFCLLSFSGCAVSKKTVEVKEVVLLPEDLIYTIPKGQSIAVLYDGQPMTITLPTDMKLVSPSTLVRQEEKLNNAVLGKAKADKDKNTWLGILGSLFSAIAGGLAVWYKKSKKD